MDEDFSEKRPDWDGYFLEIAKAVALRADCSRRQVGAVLTSSNRIVSTGYNGSPAGGPSCLFGDCPRGRLSLDEVAAFSDYESGPGRCIAVHAEANALLYAGRDAALGATLYLTCEPCSQCRKLIAACGVEKVIWPEDRYVL